MSKIKIRFQSTSALKPSEYRQFVRGWKPHPLLKNIFARQTGNTKKFRIIKTLSGLNLDITATVPALVQRAVEYAQCNITPIDYVRGYVQDKYGRLVKIGKILKANSPEHDMYVSDEQRKHDLRILNKENYVVVISIHPYDIAGMSTDRSWTSCMDLKKKDSDRVIDVKSEIDNHSIIAYLVDVKDPNITKPFARVLAKKFISDAGTEVYKIDAAYPIEDKMLSATLNKWLNTYVNPNLPKVENDYTTFRLPETSYRDGESDRELLHESLIKVEDAHNLFKYNAGHLPSIANIIRFMKVTQGSDFSSLPTDYVNSRKILLAMMKAIMYSESDIAHLAKPASMRFVGQYLKHLSRTEKLTLIEEMVARTAESPSNTLMLFSDYADKVRKFDRNEREVRSMYESTMRDYLEHYLDLKAKNDLYRRVVPRSVSLETFLIDIIENLKNFMSVNVSPSHYYGVLAVNWQTIDNIMTKDELLDMFNNSFDSLHRQFAYTGQINSSNPEQSRIGGYWGLMIGMLCTTSSDLFDWPEGVQFETLSSVLKDLDSLLAKGKAQNFNKNLILFIHSECGYNTGTYNSAYKKKLEDLLVTLPNVQAKVQLPI